MNQQRPPCRLYLVTPRLDETATFARGLDAALAAGDVAAVLLRLNEAGERMLIDRAKAIAAVVQRRDIACLIDGRPEIVARAGVDGAHLTGIEALRAALGTLKPDRIAGAGGLRSRHDAMLAAEAGADYVMFGEPLPHPSPRAAEGRTRAGGEGGLVGGDGRRPPLQALLERLAWWAELFQTPCIGYAATQDEVRLLAESGADFVALGDWIWTQPGGAEAAVAMAAKNLAASVA